MRRIKLIIHFIFSYPKLWLLNANKNKKTVEHCMYFNTNEYKL